MVEIKRGDRDVTEGDQLTLDVRRECDNEYLRRILCIVRCRCRSRTHRHASRPHG